MKRFFFVLLISLASLYSCHKEKSRPAIAKELLYQKAQSFLGQHNDSAFYYFNKVAGNSKDSLQIAMAYNQMAAIQSDAGDDFGGQESLLTSLKFLSEQEEKNRQCLASDYNELGMTSYNLKNFDASVSFYDQAVKFSDNPRLTAIVFNNQGNAYQKKRDYANALKKYRTAMSKVKPDETTYARILTNMAITKWLRQPAYPAATDLLRALHMRQAAGDLWGENSSYVHLTEYYLRSHPDSAMFYAGAMYAVATRIGSPDDRLDALQKLVALSPALSAKAYFAIYQHLNDSVQTARSAAKNQFALIRYDTEKAKTDNLRLLKDNTEKRYEILQKNILLYSGLGLFTLLMVIAWLGYRKREQRIALSFSQKVHDEVANGLYRVMKRIENEDQIETEALLDEIEALYERSRDISYEGPSPRTDSFHQLSGLLADLAGPAKVAVTGDAAGLWMELATGIKTELVCVLQELMVNMRKHSGATLVTLSFDRQGDRVEIVYSDNGHGFPEGFPKGNGLTNTGNRIQRIGGTVTFGNKEPRGARVRIVLPFS